MCLVCAIWNALDFDGRIRVQAELMHAKKLKWMGETENFELPNCQHVQSILCAVCVSEIFKSSSMRDCLGPMMFLAKTNPTFRFPQIL